LPTSSDNSEKKTPAVGWENTSKLAPGTSSVVSSFQCQQMSVVTTQQHHDIIPAKITPHEHCRALVTQSQLNNIQRNIFVTPHTDTHTSISVELALEIHPLIQTHSYHNAISLKRQVELLQQQLSQNERERNWDKIQELEMKYAEARQEVREHEWKNTRNKKPTILCVIQ